MLKETGLDDLSKKMASLDSRFGDARKSAFSSVRWFVQDAIRNEARTGQIQPFLNPHTGILERGPLATGAKGRGTGRAKMTRGREGTWGFTRVISKWSSRSDPFVRLIGAVRYKMFAGLDVDRLETGFIDNFIAAWVEKQAKGYSTSITAQMRKWFFAVGFPISRGLTTLVTPPRPWIVPVYQRIKGQIPVLFREKFYASLARHGVT